MNKLNMIKAINQRLAYLEKKGLKETFLYTNLTTAIRLYDLPLSQSKTGELRISRSEKTLQEIDPSTLERVAGKQTLKQERERLKNACLKMNEHYQEIKDYSRLSKWADENLNIVYDDARAGVESARMLEEQFKLNGEGATRHQSYQYIFKMIDDYEKEKAEWNEILERTKY